MLICSYAHKYIKIKNESAPVDQQISSIIFAIFLLK